MHTLVCFDPGSVTRLTLIIGLTGGIGSGKSSACKIFQELGIDVIDTDQISHELTQSNGQALTAIRDLFGKEYITDDNALDRVKMRQLIFNDGTMRTKLENILHPLILAETSKRIRFCKSTYVIVAVPLLFETKDYDCLIHRSLVIDCDERLQINRTMKRSHLSVEEIKSIMKAQISRQQRLEKADNIIVNNQSLSQLREQIFRLHQNYIQISAQNHQK